jgi:hypothetical protein
MKTNEYTRLYSYFELIENSQWKKIWIYTQLVDSAMMSMKKTDNFSINEQVEWLFIFD